MTDLRTMIPERVEGVHLWQAVIAETATTVDQKIKVMIPAFDATLLWGPCKWAPRFEPQTVNVAESGESAHNIVVPKFVMPIVGDQAMVCLDNTKEVWIIMWWPLIYGL